MSSSGKITYATDIPESSWLSVPRFSRVFIPEDYGGRGDAQRVNGAITSVGSVDVEVVSAPFVVGRDEGKYIIIDGAGAAGADHASFIVSVLDSSHIRIANAALTAVGGPAVLFGTDNTSAFAAMRAAVLATQTSINPGGVKIEFRGQYITDVVNLSGFHGVRVEGVGSGAYAPYAAMLIPKLNTSSVFIDIGNCSYCEFSNMVWGRPDQSEWVPSTTIGVLMAAAFGLEATAYSFHNMYFSGSYSTAAFYMEKMNQVSMKDCYVYNYHASGRAMVITASNRDNIESANYTVNNAGAAKVWGPSGGMSFDNVQFIDAGFVNSPTVRTSGIALDIDGSRNLNFKNCQYLSNNVGVRVKDVDTAAAHLSNTLIFENGIWEQPQGGGIDVPSGLPILEMDKAIELASNVTTYGLTVSQPRMRVSGAWIQDGVGAGVNTKLQEPMVLAPVSVLGTELAIKIDRDATANNRIVGGILSLAGLGVSLKGSIDPTTQRRNYGSITTTGGSDATGIAWDANRPWFKNGFILEGAILANNGTALLSVAAIASAVNSFLISGGAGSTGPTLEAVGSGTNLDVLLKPKGTGVVRNALSGGMLVDATIFDAANDLLTASAADTPARLATGTSSQVLHGGNSWGSVATGDIAADAVSQTSRVISSTGTTTSSTSYGDMADMSITMITTGGSVTVFFSGSATNSVANGGIFVAAQMDGGADAEFTSVANASAGGRNNIGGFWHFPTVSAGSRTFKIRWKVDTGTATPLARIMIAVEHKK